MSQNIDWYWRGYIWCWSMIPVKFELTIPWHVFIATTCTINTNFSVECILIFKYGLFECLYLRSLSIYMNWCKIKHSGPLFKYSHTKTHYMLMYINIHKKSPAPWYCWRRPVMALSSKFNKKCPTCLVELTN